MLKWLVLLTIENVETGVIPIDEKTSYESQLPFMRSSRLPNVSSKYRNVNWISILINGTN